MAVVLLGLNHKTAPVEMREKFSMTDAATERALSRLVDGASVEEAVVLSTCNRTELYAAGPRAAEALASLNVFLLETGGLQAGEIEKFLYTACDGEAVRHLYEVACGLDSMIIGEGQILGQVKNACAVAQGAKKTGAVLNKLFEGATRAGKRARTETAICQGATSISFVAVELAKKIFGDLAHCRILLVGAGKMSELAVKLLVGAGVQLVLVTNRTLDRAQEIASVYGGQALPFDELSAHLVKADIVISSTAAPHAVLTRELVASHLKARRGRPLFIVDIAVPRDVEPAVGKLDNVYLYNIDDLQEAVCQNIDQRCSEVDMVNAIIDEEARTFLEFLRSRDIVPVIRGMRGCFEETGKRELERVFSKNNLSEREREALSTFCDGLIHKLLHRPTVKLKEMAGAGLDPAAVDTVRELFCPQPDEERSE